MQQVMPDYSSLLAAIGTGESRADLTQSRANVNFDDRIMKEALPITRMLSADGSINKKQIKNAGRGFTDPSTLWEDLSANMPRGRGIDPIVFKEKFQAGKQLYDMNLINQLDLMRKSGMSEKKIKSQFDENPELRQYMYENGILEPPTRGMSGWKSLAIGGAGYGAFKTAQFLGPAHVGEASQKSLRGLGLEYSKKYKSVVPMSDKALTDKYIKEGMSKTGARAESKKIRDALNKNKKSFWGKQALKAGGGTGKRIGTRAVLSNVTKTVGAKAGTGLLAWAGRAITGANPYGIAANVALLALPYLIGKMTDKDRVADNNNMWR